jgi:AGZA family xanthine/uracil permease-like MFS transporter
MESYFNLRKNKTNIKTEAIAGTTTFLTMAYIIFVNPLILSSAGMDKNALIAVTCLVSAAATIAVGLIAKAPIAMAPGMGLNAFFAYLVASGKMNWQQGLGVVFISGFVFFVLTIVGLRKKIVQAIPESLISAIAVGIGLFITFIGLVKLEIVVSDEHTLVSAGKLTPTVLIGLFGLLVMLYFDMKRISGGLIIGIFAATVLALIFGKIETPDNLVALNINIKPVMFKLDILGALKWGFFGSIFTLMFMDMFDSIGTLIACCKQAGMEDENKNIRGIDKLLGIDAAATMFGALMGTSTTTSYLESAAGIEQGGRTGLTSIVTGLLFIAAVLLMPIIAIVPEYATAPALIMVGLFMTREVKKIDFTNLEQAFPSFIIIVMIALSYSISTGLAFGFISYTLIKIISAKASQVKPTMWVISILSFIFLMLDNGLFSA